MNPTIESESERGRAAAQADYDRGHPFMDWMSPVAGDALSEALHRGYGERVFELTGATTWPVEE